MALTRVVLARRLLSPIRNGASFRSLSSSAGSITDTDAALPLPHHRVHLLFGANTDVGKSIVSTGLVRAAATTAAADATSSVNYIKPLQCGGSDESFVSSHRDDRTGDERRATTEEGLAGEETPPRPIVDVDCRTLFRWETPASPHLASRWENLPVGDAEVLSSLRSSLRSIEEGTNGSIVTIIESAGGVLSPSSSSPCNNAPAATGSRFWGWSMQADLYASSKIPVVFVGDGKLGGISVTLASLEALWSRGYRVDAVVFIEGVGDEGGDGMDEDESGILFGKGNAEALREYVTMQQLRGQEQESPDIESNSLKGRPSIIDRDAIICLPPLPPMPVPLDGWYKRNQESFLNLHQLLSRRWSNRQQR